VINTERSLLHHVLTLLIIVEHSNKQLMRTKVSA
jgi:hypothetical protein